MRLLRQAPLSDRLLILTLVLVTWYSTHSFCLFFFPETFATIKREVVGIMVSAASTGASVPPASVRPTAVAAGGTAPPASLRFHSSRLDSVEFRYPLLLCSCGFFFLFTWAYVAALTTPPGSVPDAFLQREWQSSSLAMASFFEPLPLHEEELDGERSGGSSPHKSSDGRHSPRSAYPNVPRGVPASHVRIVATRDICDPVAGAVVKEEDEFFFNPQANSYTSLSNRYLNFCPFCVKFKPPRTHHCRHCDTCVLKYDHHCPWIGQCVGFFNYKNFLLLLFYAWLLSGWVLFLLMVAFREYRSENKVLKSLKGKVLTPDQIREWAEQGRLPVGKPGFGVYVCFFEALIFFLMTSALLLKHIPLLQRNRTTIDVVIQQSQSLSSDEESEATQRSEDRMLEHGHASRRSSSTPSSSSSEVENVYDLGWKRNLLHVFGDARVRDRQSSPHTAPSACHCFSDLMEGSEYRHTNFFHRWFLRLLPFRAYPPQRAWEVSVPPLSAGCSTSYGTANNTCRSSSPHTLFQQYHVVEEHLLGIRFPTKDSLDSGV